MKGEWKVFSNYGVDYFQVGRIKDTSQPLHGGNVEYAEQRIFQDKAKAETYAKELNDKEAQNV